MASNLSILVCDPHKFLLSMLYNLAYRHATEGSFLSRGYIFSPLDIFSFHNIPAPDAALINYVKKVALIIECKSSQKDIADIEKKFNKDVIADIRASISQHVRASEDEIKLEYGLFVFEKDLGYYSELVDRLSTMIEVGSNEKGFFLWHVQDQPVVDAYSDARFYHLRKHGDYQHFDDALNQLISQGIVFPEDAFFCNTLLDREASFRDVFIQVALFLQSDVISSSVMQPSNSSSDLDGLNLHNLAKRIKQEYQSPVNMRTIVDAIRMFFDVFKEFGEVRGTKVKYKKRINIELEKFHDFLKRLRNMSNHDARKCLNEISSYRKSHKEKTFEQALEEKCISK